MLQNGKIEWWGSPYADRGIWFQSKLGWLVDRFGVSWQLDLHN